MDDDERLVPVKLARVVLRDGADQQWIFLQEVEGERGFPIVIGTQEADEIYRVVHSIEPQRPLTHQLAYTAIGALGATLESVEIVALQHNTFFAQLELKESGGSVVRVDARPSDAIAIGLRAKANIRVAEEVLAEAVAEADEEPEL